MQFSCYLKFYVASLLLSLLGLINIAQAESQIIDYGVQSHTFEIQEQSLLEVIMSRLNEAKEDGKLAGLQDKFQKKVLKSIENPRPVSGLSNARTSRVWMFDPSIVQIEPILDNYRRTIVAAGTKVNPLDYVSWGQPIILINGEDDKQVAWAVKQKGKITLVKGSPIELSRKLGREVYFDQGGVL